MYSNQQRGIIRNNERNNFRILKQEQNLERNIPVSEDILDTKDFVFKKHSNSGDSGSLLLATNKKDKENRYIIKHDYYDCACNEYMYSKIGNEMGVSIAPVKMFLMTDKEKTFKSDFVCGIKYYENCESIGYNYIIENKSHINNWKDYFKFRGLESLFLESDGIEVIKNNDYIYRIDTTASFSLSHIDISYLAYDYHYKNINVRKFAEKRIMQLAKYDYENIINTWRSSIDFFSEYYDSEYLKYYFEPFYSFIKISERKINEWSNIISYFYPDIIGKYYKEYFKNLKCYVKKFLENTTNT